METEALQKEIDTLIAVLGEETRVAKPAAERAVIQQIGLLLERTRDQRTGAAREIWSAYLPYAARLCAQLSSLEEGWENDFEFFASENAQFWLDNTSALLEEGKISAVQAGLGQIVEATRLVKQDMILRVDILLQALEFALEISDKKHAILLYDEAEKIYRKNLTGSEQYAGSAWLPKIKKIGRQLSQYREKLRRYFQHTESVTVSVEAASAADLERVIDYLQQNLVGKVKITRRMKEMEVQGKSGGFRARLKITLE
jgi:hypothetical protein